MAIKYHKKADDTDYTIILVVTIIAVVIFVISKVISTSTNDYHGPRGGHYKINDNGNKQCIPRD